MNNSESSYKNNHSDKDFDLDAYLEEKSRENHTEQPLNSDKKQSSWNDAAKNSLLVVLTLILSVLWYHDWNLGKLNDRFFGASESAEIFVPPVPAPVTEPVIIHIPEPDVNVIRLSELREKALANRDRMREEALNAQLQARQEAISKINEQRLQEQLEKLNRLGDLQIDLGNTSELVQKAMELQNALRLEDLERLKSMQRELRTTDQSQ